MSDKNVKREYDVAAFIWPSYADDPRSRIFWPDGIGEWQTVIKAGAKFPGHNWPRKPLWGYVNEADPYVMEMQISAASDNGVNVFIYDWYWYDNRPFLEGCLNDGFLKAKNNGLMKFYLMWANHNVNHIWDRRNSDAETHKEYTLEDIWKAGADFERFKTIADRMFDKYFHHPSYYKIDGRPVFMIYDTATLIEGLGGIDAARRAFDYLRGRAVQEGFPGIHIQACGWGEQIDFSLSGVDSAVKPDIIKVISQLGYDSLTNYQFIHFAAANRPYSQVIDELGGHYKKFSDYGIPYFPHVSVGWDNNPRFPETLQEIISGNTPELFEKGLRQAKDYADSHLKQPPLITINSWNEWTESSYLQPDNIFGYGFLNAVKRVFK